MTITLHGTLAVFNLFATFFTFGVTVLNVNECGGIVRAWENERFSLVTFVVATALFLVNFAAFL